MYMYRRSKYMDLIIGCVYCLFLFFWYYSQRSTFNKLLIQEEEQRESITYMNSLKEELQIVFQHTLKLEELLRGEQVVHRKHYKELSAKANLYLFNISKLETELTGKLKDKEVTFQSYYIENIEIKRRHLELQQRFVRVSDDHKMLAGKSKEDLQAVRQSREMEGLSLNDRLEDLHSQKKYFQKSYVQNSGDNKRTLKKFTRCESVLSYLNSSKHHMQLLRLNLIHTEKSRQIKTSDASSKVSNSKTDNSTLVVMELKNKQLNQSTQVVESANSLHPTSPVAGDIVTEPLVTIDKINKSASLRDIS